MHVIWLDSAAALDHTQVGIKAARLSALRRAGLPVPNGFCIPLEAAGQGTDELWSKVAQAYYQLTSAGGAVAVRSSGVSEDSEGASFAGQYETVLSVTGVEALQSAIKRCWQSAHSARAQAYQARHAGEKEARRLPLLVQLQVPASASGVLFTADPVSGDCGQTLIEATPGLGEALMSGRVAPARYRVDQQGHVQALSSSEVLTPAQCRVLTRLSAQVQHLLGGNQDIEWAVVQDQVYILQARPITCTAPSLPLSRVWTRANIGEVLPDVVTPLTWSVFQATLLQNPASAFGKGADEAQGDEGVRRFSGRAYIRLDCLLDSFCYLPTVTPTVMRQVLGIHLPSTTESYTPPGGMLVRLAQGAFLLGALGFLPRLHWLTRRLPPMPDIKASTHPQVREQLTGLLTWTASCFRLHLKCTAHAVGAFSLLAYCLRRWLPSDAQTFLPQVLMGHEDMQTAAQGVSLWRLAEQVRVHSTLPEILNARLDWPTMSRQLKDTAGGPEFLQALQSFLEQNGARTAGEFELAIPRWREDPSFVLTVLRKYLETQATTLDRGGSTLRHRRRQQAVSRIKASLRPLQKRIFMQLLASYSNYTTSRENVKYRLMEGYALIRQVFLEMGTTLVARGVLDDAGDIFFLTPSEVLALDAGQKLARETSVLLAQRQAQHANWESLDAPILIMDDEREVARPQGDALTGIGCSPGTAEGIARVLSDPSEAHMLRPGEILVALHTDPGWTPLFLSCKAVVTEIGGFLSHGATVAREYGIPAVVNVRGATSMIRAGDCITVDGSKGTVVLHKTQEDLTQRDSLSWQQELSQ
jgi:phosphohistidine swiveling domain-containing protein